MKTKTIGIATRAVIALVFFSAMGMSGCHDSETSSPPPPPPPPAMGSATLTPGVNPAFDSIASVATSATAGGSYTVDAGATYNAATETVTLTANSIPQGGLYVRVMGDATIGGVSSSYTIYTYAAYAAASTTQVAVNELTSIAVGYVADGSSASFLSAVDRVASELTAVSSANITAPVTAAERDDAVTASMMAISNLFENGAFTPGTTSASDTSAAVGECIALGGLVYDDMSQVNAGGIGALPAGEPSIDYQRCKSCHGWDQMGTDGGYVRRSRNASRPNAGLGDPNSVSRNIRTGVGGVQSISLDMVLHAGTGRSFAEGSAIFDGTAPWGPGTQKGNEHPDLSTDGVNSGAAPSADQMRCATAFLNHPEARAHAVFALIDLNTDPTDPVPDWCTTAKCAEYTMVSTADANRGDTWYHDPQGGNCVTCHGEPEDPVGPIADGPPGGLLAFLREDGKYSEFRHKTQWGESGNDLMTRGNMNNPTAADVADVLAYMQDKIEADVQMACIELGGLVYDDMSQIDAGGSGILPVAEPVADYQRCKSCHGWDQLGTDGAYVRRSRNASRPNAGLGDPNLVSRNISNDLTFGAVTGAISEVMVLHAGSGRSWADGSAIFDATSPSWGPGAQKGNEHPDLSSGGVNGTDVPSNEQIACVTEFLNYPDARINAVFAAINPTPATVPAWCTNAQCVEYTLVATANAARGDTWYHDPQGGNCVTCHGEPEDAVGPIAGGPPGGLLAFARQDGKHSEIRHKVQWGEAGDPLMTRANMNHPTAADVADLLAFLDARIAALVSGQPVANDDNANTLQNTPVDIDVLANDTDSNGDTLTVNAFGALSTNGGSVNCTGTGICTYTPTAAFTGNDTFTYTITDGTQVSAAATVTVIVSAPGGDPAAGQARFVAECGVCHAAAPFDTTTALGGSDLGGRGQALIDEGRLINNMVETDPLMVGIVLTDQEILDMAAFLDSL